MKPRARTDLAMCNVRDEVVVYDFQSHQARCLNTMAAAVFRLCDGTRTPPQMAAALSTQLGSTVDEEVVWLALGQLDDGALLHPPLGDKRTDIGRRRILKKMALTAGLSVALPAVWSIVAPTPAYAASAPIMCNPPQSCMGNPSGCCQRADGTAGVCSGGTCTGTSSTCHGQPCR